MSIVVNSLCRKREIEWRSFVADSLWERKNDNWSRLTSWLAHWRDRFWPCYWSRLTIEWLTRWRDQYRTRLWSRLTVDSSLLHVCNRACFVHAFVADSLFLSFKQTLFIQLQIFNDKWISAHIFVISDI